MCGNRYPLQLEGSVLLGRILRLNTKQSAGKPKPLSAAHMAQKESQGRGDWTTRMSTRSMLGKGICQLVPRMPTMSPAMPPLDYNEAFQEERNWPKQGGDRGLFGRAESLSPHEGKHSVWPKSARQARGSLKGPQQGP